MLDYINCEEYGAKLRPPITRGRVQTLCRQGRIPGAQRMPGKTGIWLIPRAALDAPDPRKLIHRKNY